MKRPVFATYQMSDGSTGDAAHMGRHVDNSVNMSDWE